MVKFIKFTIKAIAIVLIFALALYGALYYAYKPRLSGTFEHNHPQYGNISIRRDEYGIPRIKGQEYNSVCYGQGFATAQDRIFSMYIKRALIQGKLSEIDKVGVNSDTFFRTLGIHRIAKNTVKNLSKQSLSCYQAYADGVNDYYHSLPYKPFEFLVTQSTWTDWTPYDSICFIKFMTFLLGMDYMFEPLRTQLSKQFGVDEALFMTGIHPEKQLMPDTVLNDEELKQSGIYSLFNRTLIDDINQNHVHMNYTQDQYKKIMNSTLSNLLFDLYSTSYGSNSWVIHGNYTKSGKPLLGNDPHLQNGIPSIWYQTELLFEKGNATVQGVTIPGIPLVVCGKSDFAAFGVTVLYADTSDLYVEKVEGDKYLVDGEWRQLRIINETFNVKGENSVNLQIKYTHRGPLIDYTTDFNFPNPFLKHGLTTSLALTTQIEQDNALDYLTTFIFSKKTQEIKDSLSKFTGPALSIVYATESGDIGQFGISQLPISKYPLMGPFLKDGTTTKYDWVRFTNGNENPQILNPKKGYIVSANNKFATNNIKHHYSTTVSCTPRASRVNELIQKQIKEGKKFDVEDMKRIQSDTLDVFAREVTPHINVLFLRHGEKQAKHTLQQIMQWDFRLDADSLKAPYFSAWEYLYSDKSMLSFETTPENRAILTKGRLFWHFQFSKIIDWSNGNNTDFNEKWCKSEQNKHSEYACLYNVFMALAETQNFLDEKYSYDKKLGKYPQKQLPSLPFHQKSYPGFGNARTVAVAIPNYLYNSFNANQGANYRSIYDLSQRHEKNYYLIDTGSSENIFSPHYDDQFKMHNKFEFIEMKSGFKNFMSNQKYIFELKYKQQDKQKKEESKKGDF